MSLSSSYFSTPIEYEQFWKQQYLQQKRKYKQLKKQLGGVVNYSQLSVRGGHSTRSVRRSASAVGLDHIHDLRGGSALQASGIFVILSIVLFPITLLSSILAIKEGSHALVFSKLKSAYMGMLAQKSTKRYLVEKVIGSTPYILYKPIIMYASKQPHLQQLAAELQKFYDEYHKVKGASGRTISKISRSLRKRGGDISQLSASDKIEAAQAVTKMNMAIVAAKIELAMIAHVKVRAPEEAQKMQQKLNEIHQQAKYKAQEINRRIDQSRARGKIDEVKLYGQYIVDISKSNMKRMKAQIVESMESVYGKAVNWRQAKVSAAEQQLLNEIANL